MYYFASHVYGEEPRLFFDPEEIAQELAALEETVKEATERLARIDTALSVIETLPASAPEQAARCAVTERLYEAKEQTEALLAAERESLRVFKEEWEDTRFILYGAKRRTL